MLDKELEHYIETEIIPRYDTFDKAHRTDHVRTVIARSLALARQMGADEEMAYAIAAYHDTGLAVERERHHLISGEILMADPQLCQWFTQEQLHTMRDAVEDHRASSDREPRTLSGRIVAEADRVIEPETILRRTVQYGLSHYPALNREEHYLRLKQHLGHKYAEGGYLRLWLPEAENVQQLKTLRAIMDDETQLQALFEKIYAAETASTPDSDCKM